MRAQLAVLDSKIRERATRFAFAGLALFHVAWVAVQATEAPDPITPSIIGGNNASPNEYPWMVAIVGGPTFVASDIPQSVHCGGVLIHPYWVLTAAHCVDRLDSWDHLAVVLSDGNLSRNTELIPVRRVAIHPQYDPGSRRDFDFALLHLERPVLGRAPLAVNTDPERHRRIGSAVALGWGATVPTREDPQPPAWLQEATLQILDHDYANLPDLFNGALTDTMIAAGRESPRRTAYAGDSGGPLLTAGLGGGPRMLLGITSWGPTCRIEEIPYGVFGNVALQAGWIRSVVSPDALEFSSTDDYQTAKVQGRPNRAFPLRLRETQDGPRLAIILPIDGLSSTKILYAQQPVSRPSPLSWSELPFEPFLQDWHLNLVQSCIEIEPPESSPVLVKWESRGQLAPTLHPIPVGVGTRVWGRRFDGAPGPQANFHSLYELVDISPGDRISLAAWATDNEALALGLLEVDSQSTRMVAENVSDHSYRLQRSHWLEATAREDKRYYAVVQRYGNSDDSFELTYWTNSEIQHIPSYATTQARLDTSDARLGRSGRRFDLYQTDQSSRFDLLFEVQSDFDAVLEFIIAESGHVLSRVDAAPAGETETLVFDPRVEGATWALRVSSAEAGSMGKYSIRPRLFENRSSVSVGNTQRGLLTSRSTKRVSPEGIEVYFQEYDLEGLDPGRRTYLTVFGHSGYTAQFAIADRNQGSYIATGSSRCESDATVSFVPTSGNAYKLLVAGIKSDLNGNFTIALAHQAPQLPSIFSSERFSFPSDLGQDLFGFAPPPLADTH